MTHKDVADQVNPKSNVLEFGERIAEWNERCFSGWINRKLPVSMLEDFNRWEEERSTYRQISREVINGLQMPSLQRECAANEQTYRRGTFEDQLAFLSTLLVWRG